MEMARVVKPFMFKSRYRLVQRTVKTHERFCRFSMERESSFPQQSNCMLQSRENVLPLKT